MDISVIKQNVDYCYKALCIYIIAYKYYHKKLACIINMGFIESVTNFSTNNSYLTIKEICVV